MAGKIDIHTHILPEIDDGAADMTESLRLLQLAEKQGIREVIATPHFSGKFRNTDPARIRQLCRAVQNAVYRKYGTKFPVWPGQEIMYGEEVLRLLGERKLLTLADSRYVLIEFWPSAPYSYIFAAIRELLMEGYEPVLAHVERYMVLREEGRIEELRDQGAYIQMNYRPAGGKWYHGTTRWCRKQLRRRQVDFLGTDMHNLRGRRPETKDASEWLEKALERWYIDRITRGNARRVIRNESIER